MFEVLETGQRLPLKLLGEALYSRVAISQNGLSFGECEQYDHREIPIKLTNRQEMPFQFSLSPTANFAVKPAEGAASIPTIIPGLGTVELMASFRPHQLGPLRGTLQLLGFGGKVSTQSIRMQGHCHQAMKRVPAGGIDKLPEDFEEPPKIVLPPMPGDPPTGATWNRQQTWDVSAAYEGTNLSVLQALRKRKTYKAQQAKREVFDTIDRMDTGCATEPPSRDDPSANAAPHPPTVPRTQRPTLALDPAPNAPPSHCAPIKRPHISPAHVSPAHTFAPPCPRAALSPQARAHVGYTRCRCITVTFAVTFPLPPRQARADVGGAARRRRSPPVLQRFPQIGARGA